MASCKGSFSKMQTHFEEYCSRSSLHGLQYIGDKTIPLLERLIWICVWIVSLTICGILIGRVYEKWEMSPVIVSLAPSESPIWKIPFPAVTVCDNTRARASVFHYADVERRYKQGEPMTDMERTYMNLVYLTCPENSTTSDYEMIIDNAAARTLMELGTGIDIIALAEFQGYEDDPETSIASLFYPRLTELGVCYTFNLLATEDFYTEEAWIDPVFDKVPYPSNWTMFSSYIPGSSLGAFPFRALLSGDDFGLTMHLKYLNDEEGFICKGREPGFKIMLHNPGELPAVNTRFLDVPLNTQLNVAVAPNMILTSDNLKNYKPERRECYFPTDRPLRYYREYTQSKCRFECQTNYTLLKCGCVAFYMPRAENTKICGNGKKYCVNDARTDLWSHELMKVEMNLEYGYKEEFTDSSCGCLPACSDLTYELETANSPLNMNRYMKSGAINITSTTSIAIVKIYFKVDQFIASQRSELFGVTEFIAYSGGLLGLFLGFSLLSLCEIAYFMSLRAAHALCRPRSPNTTDIQSRDTSVRQQQESC